jgi:pyruvate,water dikinase
VIGPHPEVVAYLQQAKDDGFLDGLLPLEGGPEAHDAIRAYLDRYGMRCAGEIDVTRTRWREAPTTLVPLLLSNVKNFEARAASRKFERGRQEDSKKEQELLDRLKQLPDGDRP